MDLDRGVLARVDRSLLAGLGQDEACRMVRVPVSEAKWSTWRRYCRSVGVSMGRALAMFIDAELAAVFGDADSDRPLVLAERVEDALARREAAVTRRERDLKEVESRLRNRSIQLRRREGEIEARELRVEQAVKLSARPEVAWSKVGRNERCPCGSGFKFKHCHGLPAHPPNAIPR
jgi:hypothetical protein